MKYLVLTLLSSFWLVLPLSALACPDIDGLADLNCDGRVEIICFGDSITYGEKDATGAGYPGRLEDSNFPHAVIRNFGKPGEDTPNGRNRAAQKFAAYSSSDYSIILEGVNDFFDATHSASNTRNNLQSMLRSAANTGSKASLATLTDIRRSNQQGWVNSVNSAIRPYTTIDFFALGKGIISSDNLHPNGDGYQAMQAVAAQRLRAISAASRPADSDGDGLYDFEESRYGTSAAVADSDGDGIADGEEVFVYHTGPLLEDTDGDGVSDYEEAKVRHTDPLSLIPTPPTITKLEAIP